MRSTGPPSNPWNLVIITADDLNADSVGWMGSTIGATPGLDAFAATAHQFRNCHVVSPLCQPSRSALMTGCVPHRNGALGFEPVRPDVTTLTELLGSRGFFTGAINKTSHMLPRAKFNWDLILEGSGKNPKAFRAHFEQCLEAAAGAGKPFFINANSTDAHGPFPSPGAEAIVARTENEARAAPVEVFKEAEIVVPSFLEDLPAVRKELAQYFSGVRRLDQSFSELMAALEAAGRLHDTIIVFLSDHGMSMPYSKATLYRSATWTPALLRWPDMQPPVANTDMVSSVDLMPTVLELLGIDRPEGLDGCSCLPLLRDAPQSGRDHVFTQVDSISSGKSFPGRCVRTKSRAYIWNSWPDGKTRFGIGTTETRLSWKAMVEAGASDLKLKKRVDHFIYRSVEEFYDEENDPDERHNLIHDPAWQTEIAQLKALLEAQMEKTNDPLLPQFRRVQGKRGSLFRRIFRH